jgi:ADP-ribose pyrophosphatase YjhB (NUDIX family)
MKQVFTAQGERQDGSPGRYEFCPFCGTELVPKKRGGQQRPVCPDCGFVQYRNPLPGVVAVIEQDGAVLLGRRKGGFGAGKWGLPQGYVEYDEDFLSAALREVKEETGLDVEIRAIINVVSNLLLPGLQTLGIVLRASVIGGDLRAGDDMEALDWFPLSGPLPEMAFEADTMIIERVRMKLEAELPVDPRFAR